MLADEVTNERQSVAFILEILGHMGCVIDAEYAERYIQVTRQDNLITYHLLGDVFDELFGVTDGGDGCSHSGFNIDLLHAMATILGRTKWQAESSCRCQFDVNHYRQRRSEMLKPLAEALVQGAQNHKSISCFGLDGMDRKAIHHHIKHVPEAETHSHGVGPFRRLEIRVQDADSDAQ